MVAEDVRHVVVAREDPAPASLVEVDRVVLAQTLVVDVRIAQELLRRPVEGVRSGLLDGLGHARSPRVVRPLYLQSDCNNRQARVPSPRRSRTDPTSDSATPRARWTAPTGSNASAAARSWASSASLSSISAAAALDSSCSTLDAPGIATTLGLRMSHASAICAGLAWWVAAMSRGHRSAARPARGSRGGTTGSRGGSRRTAGSTRRTVRRAGPARAGCTRSRGARSLAPTGAISSSGRRSTRLKRTWLDSTGSRARTPPPANGRACSC